jgi:hypothetical protein
LVLLPARARDDQPAAIDTGDELDLPEMESIAERSA